MQDLERVHEGAEFHRTQEMVGAGGTPTQGALRFEKGLHEEEAAGGHALQDPGHAGTIKIIEEQDRIKTPEFWPRLLEVKLQPGDPRSLPLGLAAGLRQPGGVLVHGQHRGPERRRREAVTPGTAGQVEHPAPRRNPVGVPGEPVTRAVTVQT